MQSFLKDIITYLQSELDGDTDFENTITVNRAYKKNTTIKSPQVSVYVISDDDYKTAETFDEEHATQFPIQFYCYWKDGLKIGENALGAQLGAESFGEKVSALFENKDKAITYNSNILMIDKIGGAPFGMPISDGSTNYVTAPRFIFTVKKPYVAIN